jgi:hypothetical protein
MKTEHQDNQAFPAMQPGTIKPVPQAGSYATPAAAGDLSAAKKVADGAAKGPGETCPGATCKNLGTFGS